MSSKPVRELLYHIYIYMNSTEILYVVSHQILYHIPYITYIKQFTTVI